MRNGSKCTATVRRLTWIFEGCSSGSQVRPFDSFLQNEVHHRAIILLDVRDVFTISTQLRRYAFEQLKPIVVLMFSASSLFRAWQNRGHTNDVADFVPTPQLIVNIPHGQLSLVEFVHFCQVIRAFFCPLVFRYIDIPKRNLGHVSKSSAESRGLPSCHYVSLSALDQTVAGVLRAILLLGKRPRMPASLRCGLRGIGPLGQVIGTKPHGLLIRRRPMYGAFAMLQTCVLGVPTLNAICLVSCHAARV